MRYWLTGSAGPSANIYCEAMHAASWGQQPRTGFVDDVRAFFRGLR